MATKRQAKPKVSRPESRGGGKKLSRRALVLQELDHRASTLVSLNEGEKAGPLDYAVSWIESGKTILQLAESIGETLGVELPRNQLSSLLNSIGGEAGRQRLAAAREVGAHAMAETTLTIVDDSGASRDELHKSRLRADSRRWLAEKWNRNEYGQQKQSIEINLTSGGSLLDMIRVRVSDGSAAEPERVEDAEYALLPDETS